MRVLAIFLVLLAGAQAASARPAFQQSARHLLAGPTCVVCNAACYDVVPDTAASTVTVSLVRGCALSELWAWGRARGALAKAPASSTGALAIYSRTLPTHT